MKKRIFGKIYSFDATGDYRELVARSIDAYPEADDGDSPDVEVFASDNVDATGTPRYRNPKIFAQYEDSFLTDFGPVCIRWSANEGGRLSVRVCLREPSKMFSPMRRWRSMEYANVLEYFQQVLHELVLVPSVFFFDAHVPMHAAGVSVRGKAVLIAGTGGTGKTSALLSLREQPGVSFLSDDICVLSSDGSVFPNLSWPKIYGYNVSDARLQRLVLEGRGWIDRLHFEARRRANPARVRRKIQPGRLFRDAAKSEVPLAAVLMLARADVTDLVVEPLDIPRAVQMNIAVMQTEYFTFFRFLLWKEFNDLFVSEGNGITARVLERWRRNLTRAFDSSRILAVKIPLAMRHEDYIGCVREILLEEAVR